MYIEHQDESYKRGLVLGLTMAEIVILVLFCLLLALAAIFSYHRDELVRRDAIIEIQSTQLNAMEELGLVEVGDLALIQDLKAYWEQYGPSDTSFRDYFSQLVLRVQELRDLRSRLEELVERSERLGDQLRAAEASSARMRAELAEVRAELESSRGQLEFLVALEIDPGREEDRRRVEEALAALELVETSGGDFREVVETLGRLQSEVGGLTRLVGYYERLFGFPPCWHDGDWRIDYTFDVTFTTNGFILRTVPQPRHADHPVMPAVQAVTTGRELTSGQFATQTKPIYDWSVAHQCRFFVTVYDGTAEDEKRIFQERMRVLEGHFYKRERLNVPPPF